jgi:hypothetical protein
MVLDNTICANFPHGTLWNSQRVRGALTPGGYLLYGDYVGDRVTQGIHENWLGRLLLFRPAETLRIVAATPR